MPEPVLAVRMLPLPAQKVVLPVILAVAPVPSVKIIPADVEEQPDSVTTTS
ncbi:MAG: hypothetical protein IPJ79_09395 [Bacteroidetes bacterium]|nr:hypothetical protein [Bacteroidota bacterium]